MSDDRTFERNARAWLELGPTDAPDRVVEAALLAIEQANQERDLRVPWRLPTMTPLTRLAMMAAVAVVVVGTAVLALRPTANVGAAPSPSPAPATRPPNIDTPAPYFPSSPLPNPAGNALPADLTGRTYEGNPLEVQGTQRLILTLRAADDPHCAAMFEGRSTCFTYLWTPNFPKHITDPGARGSARIVDGRLVLSFDIVPFDLPCVGQKATYAIESAGATLTGVDPPACTVPAFVAVPIPAD
jgi:hypothetical protein